MFLKHKVEELTVNFARNSMFKGLKKSLNVDILEKNYERVPKNGAKYMLYAHIPFCHVFCPYCSFHKYAYNENLCKEYFNSLRKEMLHIKNQGYNFNTFYIGGGTTLINEYELQKTIQLAKELFSITEVSCESDPNHISRDSLYNFKGLIHRLSVGVQSFDDSILKKISRYDKFGSQEILIQKLNQAMDILPILSLDLIFNFPFQTEEMLLKDIEISKNISPQQITFYPLMKSQVTRDAIAKSIGISDTDNERKFYEIIRENFKDYNQNNAWAFSKNNSGLNDEYVGSNHEYVGIGSGAFSFLNGRLLINAFNLEDYCKLVNSKKSAVIASCDFKKIDKIRYIFLTELFDGCVDIQKFNKNNHCNVKIALFYEITSLKITNAIIEKSGKIYPTDFGRYICVVLMKEFYAGMDIVRAVFRDDAKIKSFKRFNIIQEAVN